MSLESSAIVLAWICIIVLTFAVAGLHHQLRLLASGGSQLSRLGPTPGQPVPALREEIDEIPGTKILLFVDTTCTSCISALGEASKLARKYSQVAFVAVFENEANGYANGKIRVISNASEAFLAFGVRARPTAVLVDGAGAAILAKPVGSTDALRRLAREASRTSLPREELK
jgi:hypothetical protein